MQFWWPYDKATFRIDTCCARKATAASSKGTACAALNCRGLRPKEEGDETKHARATFELEPQGSVVRLTVTHDGLDPQMLAGISGGWPMVLSNLKTFLEQGRALPKPVWM